MHYDCKEIIILNRKLNITEEGVEAEVTLTQVSSLPKTYNNDVFKDNFGVSYKLDRSNSSNNFSFTLFSDGLFYLCEFRYLFVSIWCGSYKLISTHSNNRFLIPKYHVALFFVVNGYSVNGNG